MSKITKKISTRFFILQELFGFFWSYKLWWLIPMLFIIVIIGVLIIFANATPLAPFIYPLF